MITNWQDFETILINYRDTTLSIRLALYSYEKEINSVSKQIALVSFENAQNLFDRLYEIQNCLATVLYKYEFQINEKLKAFIYHFERDDSYSREYYYKKFLEDTEWFVKE